ncbi:MAG: hypothetical protein ABFC56_12415 [Clostridiaceae bacterium]
MKTALMAMALALVGCGSGFELKAGDAAKPTAAVADEQAQTVEFNGSVGYAFEMSVNGQKYSDIESYYTSEASTLLEKVAAAGHNVDAVEFQGKLGFADFIEDMEVFVASSLGSQGKSVVDAQGNFAVTVPNLKKGPASFKVRATKRVQIVLFSGGVATKRLCYNFAAVEKDVVENPIMLSDFTTDFTLYDCEQQNAGIAIPAAAAAPAIERTVEACGHVDSMWIKGSEFILSACDAQQKYTLSSFGSPAAVGAPVETDEEPEGFAPLAQVYGTDSKYIVPMGGDSLYMTDYGDSATVAQVRNSVVLRSFRVPFGLAFFAVDGERIFAVARVAGKNSWKVGELDVVNSRFIPRGDAPEGLLISAAGIFNGQFTVVAGNKVHFFRF